MENIKASNGFTIGINVNKENTNEPYIPEDAVRNLKIESLAKNGWIDSDEIMLHACFQILKDCVEQEHVDTHCNYAAHKDFVDEVRFLYQWWINRSQKPTSIEQNIEDDLMLIRLMKIRTGLWT